MANPQDQDLKGPYDQSDDVNPIDSKNQDKSGDPKDKCPRLDPGPKAPDLPPSKSCPTACDCPTDPPTDQTCLDALIVAQAGIVNAAKRAEEFKKELVDLLAKANAAKKAYTRDKYEDFKKRWRKQDAEIVCAIEHVTCKVKCWQCLIECEICPLLYKIRDIERKLDGDDLISQVYSLYDLRHWHERNFEAKKRRFDRIKAVLAAWSDPAKSIDAALGANDKLLKSLSSLAPEEAVLQLFFKLIPLHLAIRPRTIATDIDSQYRNLCATDCDEGECDDCCGPDVGVLTARQRLVEPQAYIEDPDNYFDILCCLARERYLPAKDQMAQAEADKIAAQAAIESNVAELDRRKKSLFDDYRANIATPLDCDKYKKKAGGGGCGGDDDDQAADPTIS